MSAPGRCSKIEGAAFAWDWGLRAVGAFPAPPAYPPAPVRRGPRMQQVLVDPAEATGIETLADQLEMSLCELVTLAIDHWYSEDRPTP